MTCPGANPQRSGQPESGGSEPTPRDRRSTGDGDPDLRVTAGKRSRHIVLINPNSSVATTDMMVAIARQAAGGACAVTGRTATRAPAMIADAAALLASGDEVVAIGLASQDDCDGMIVAAFGDPGLAALRARSRRPSVGIAEAAMLEAASGGRRFGVATTTPALVAQIDARAAALGLAAHYTGTRLARGDAHALVRSPELLRAALAVCVEECITRDGAQAVIIGGGPLAQAARDIQQASGVPIIAPVPAAIRRLLTLLGPDIPARS